MARAAGYAPPQIEEVNVGIGYTSRVFKRHPCDLGGDLGAVLVSRPPYDQRMGFVLAMEGDRWIVSAGGWNGNHAPTDPKGFLEFLQSLPRPDIYDVAKRAEPLTDLAKHAFPSNLRRRYETLKRFPGNYVVMGDAVCSFNPLYGQGMSVAALEALTLEECLRTAQNVEHLWREFFKASAKVIDTPWTIAAGSDFAYEGVTGPKPAGTDMVNWYLDRVHKAASRDQYVCRTFFDVANLLRPATALFHPMIAARVWRECWALRSPLAIGTDSALDSQRRMLET